MINIFLLQIIGHIQDPKGEKVFLRTTEAGTNNNSLNPVSFPLKKKSGTTGGGSSTSGEDRAPPFFRPKSNSISIVDSQKQKSNSLSISDDSVEALKKKIIELEKIISCNQVKALYMYAAHLRLCTLADISIFITLSGQLYNSQVTSSDYF